MENGVLYLVVPGKAHSERYGIRSGNKSTKSTTKSRYIATRELWISGSEVAGRLNVDRSAISRAVQRAGNNADLIAAAGTILEPLEL